MSLSVSSYDLQQLTDTYVSILYPENMFDLFKP